MGKLRRTVDRFRKLDKNQRNLVIVVAAFGLAGVVALLVAPSKDPEAPAVVVEEEPTVTQQSQPRPTSHAVEMSEEGAKYFAVRVQQFMERVEPEIVRLAGQQAETAKLLNTVVEELATMKRAYDEIHEGMDTEIRNLKERPVGGGTAGAEDAGGVEARPPSPLEWRTFEREGDEHGDAAPAGAGKRYALPSGSTAPVVLVNGVEAPPPGQGGPYPMLLYVQEPFRAGNGARVPLQGCVLLGYGEGSLSMERVIIKLDRLSCVFPGGRTLDKAIEGSVSGDDGKFGVPGRVIHRAGSKLAMATLLGGATGISQALGASQTTRLVAADGTERSVVTGDIVTFGATGAALSALNELVTFYRRALEQTFPVVEVLNGVKGTVVISRPAHIPEIEALVRSGG